MAASTQPATAINAAAINQMSGRRVFDISAGTVQIRHPSWLDATSPQQDKFKYVGVFGGNVAGGALGELALAGQATKLSNYRSLNLIGSEGWSAAESAGVRTNFNVYEVLSEQPITGASRGAHRASANRGLYGDLKADPGFARMFDTELNADVLGHMSSGKSLLNPPGTVWHHPVENPGVMQLLRSTEHTNPLIRPTLHPEGVGGFGTYYGN